MSSSENAQESKRIVRRIFEELLPAATFPTELATLVSPDYVDHDPVDAARARGVEAIATTHAYLHERFAGKVAFTIDDIIAEDDVVAVRWSAGPARAIAWFRLRDGQLVDRWAVVTRAGDS